MITTIKWLTIIIASLVVLYFGLKAYYLYVVNPRVTEEIQNNPEGERAGIVMLLGFPDGKSIPVNYLKEGDKVFAGADGRWWRAFRDDGASVTMLIRGETLRGHAVVILDDPDYTHDVFIRLRPTVPDWLPDRLNGKLIEITLTQTQ